ncbi:hypothetical protein JVU11DRAFT_10922 [Chiua virens]|nr:hypothetical protein JVU11DRAFT_10922 [Chiua virens]
MSDPRFASLKTDPRFRRPKKSQSKVVLDDRFKDLLGDEKKGKKKSRKQAGACNTSECRLLRYLTVNHSPCVPTIARVDKYGRTVAETQEKDDLRRFYRLEAEDGEVEEPTVVDYARGAVLMESSDEEEEDDGDLPPRALPLKNASGSDSDEGGFISLGIEPNDLDEADELEIDLDENTIATLDAQVAEYARADSEREQDSNVKQARRLAVVNLDWDHVRAVHLYKIFSSLISPTAPLASTSTSYTDKSTPSASKGGVTVVRGRILSVRVYPSEFGKQRMAREEKEGPPTDVFKKKKRDEDINEKTIFETGTGEDYDEDALRKYQLERLRYYYAVVECDAVETAAHVYNELEGTELERSANVFDLSFVPDDMIFDDEPRDEATQLPDAPYRAVEFVTDALRHSKVKLTWDEDDPERNHILRRPLTKKELDEADFRAYIASSSSSEDGSGDEAGEPKMGKDKTKKEGNTSKKAERDKLRMLLLGGDDDELPEGWGNAFDNKGSRGDTKSKARGGEDNDVDMEVTFMPGLSETKNPEDENTLEKYQRKVKEKKKKRKEDVKKTEGSTLQETDPKASFDDEFFGAESDSRHEEDAPSKRSGKKITKPDERSGSSKAELALLVASDNPHGEAAHFDMKAVLKAEKQAKNKRSRRKFKNRGRESDVDDGPGETQDDFEINVKDDRFAAVHEDHQFAIDPTNPHFKKTKSMAALLDERSKRQKGHRRSHDPVYSQSPTHGRSLQSLVESVKRKGTAIDRAELGKRHKLREVAHP